jgi:hypothetical protein
MAGTSEGAYKAWETKRGGGMPTGKTSDDVRNLAQKVKNSMSDDLIARQQRLSDKIDVDRMSKYAQLDGNYTGVVTEIEESLGYKAVLKSESQVLFKPPSYDLARRNLTSVLGKPDKVRHGQSVWTLKTATVILDHVVGGGNAELRVFKKKTK